MLPRVIVAVVLMSLLPVVRPAQCQYMYLDANGDGLHNTEDRLSPTDTTTLEVWIDASYNRDGSPSTCSDSGSVMTINSYEFILRAVAGTLEWISYTNLRPEMGTNLGMAADSTEYHNGFGGGTATPPGRYHLGTLIVATLGGNPSVEIVPTTPLNGAFRTSFGSQCSGTDADNTLKLGTDWFDADGAQAADLPPTITAPSAVASEEGASVIIEAQVLSQLPDGPPTVSAQGYPASLTFEATTTGGSSVSAYLQGELGPSDAGSYTILWDAMEAGGSSATDTTILEITSVNFDPVVYAPATRSCVEGTVLTFSVHVEDPDDDPISSLAANLNFLPADHEASFTTTPDNTTATFIWTPRYTHAGTYHVTFTATARSMSGSATTEITVLNDPNPPPWASRSVRLQLPAQGYKVNVRWFDNLCNGLCRNETLTAGDSGQVYVSVRQSSDPDEDAPLYDMIHVEFPAANHAAYFTVPQSQEDPLSYTWSDPSFIGQPVEWFPNEALPPYNYDFVPTNASADFIRLLAVAEQIVKLWWDVYDMPISPEEIRLWEGLNVPSFSHSAFFSYDFIKWPWDVGRYSDTPATEAHILAHEFTHVMQYRAIYDGDFPEGSGEHFGCETGEPQKAWKEGMADGMAEYFTVTVRGERLGSTDFEGDRYYGPGSEAPTSQWTCDHYGVDVENSVALYVYLMNRRDPVGFMDCLRFATFDSGISGEERARTLYEFHALWNDLDIGIISHRPGSWNDEVIYRYAQNLVTGVEGDSPPIDTFGSLRKVYPSPTRDRLKAEALGPGTGAATIRIVAPSGRVLREFQYTGLTSGVYHTLDVDVSGLPSGIYFLVYKDSTERGIKASMKIAVLK